MLLKTHAPESQHWYSQDGTPAYEVTGANGKVRPATLRDARKLGLVPSVTSILKCAAAPGLERWKQEQVLLAALTLPRNAQEAESDWLDRVMRDSKEQGRKAADRGSKIHAAVQGHYEGESCDPECWDFVKATAEKMSKAFPDADWRPEDSFACDMGFGGKVDIHCKKTPVVADFKTKEFADPEQKLAWDEHCIQLAAYRHGLGIPKARCANVFISVSQPGLVVIHEWPEEELERGWRMFCGLLSYWKAKSNYVPQFDFEAV